MDTTLPPDELLSRARNALFARRIHLLSLLRHLLLALRRHLATHRTFDTRYFALSHILHLFRLTREHRPLTWLHLTPSPPPPSPSRFMPPPQPQSQQPSQPSSPANRPRRFQSRTFFRGIVVDERRAPAAAWPLPFRHGSWSLSVAPSAGSLSTLTSSGPPGTASAGSSAPPSRISSFRSLHSYGYAGFRVDPSPMPIHYAALPMPGATPGARTSARSTRLRPNPADAMKGIGDAKEERFFRPDAQALEVIRLRDNVFEIGRDGRIRRQKNIP